MTAVNLRECLLSFSVNVFLSEVNLLLQTKVYFAIEETKKKKNRQCLRQRSKGFQPIPAYKNKSTEMHNLFGHLTSLSG